MKIGVVGLGLIGGSLARAYAKSGHTVYAQDQDDHIFTFAQLAGIVTDHLDEKNIPECELILLAVYPQGVCKWLEEHAKIISRDTLVIDCCGVKSQVIRTCFPIAEENGFIFVGGHPMAGTHNSGFKFSRSNLFQGAPMVLVPPRFDDIQLLDRVKNALIPCCFGSFSVTTAEKHDEMIAFTSQMPHVLSNAFIKSPTAKNHKGFSAGSYKDMTRVAWLNPQMWAELFLENREHMLFELNGYIDELMKYQKALDSKNREQLIALLEEGRQAKKEVDG